MKHSIVVPEGGRYGIVVGIRHSRVGEVRFPKGDNFCHLKVNRLDLRTDGNPTPPPAPDLPLN